MREIYRDNNSEIVEIPPARRTLLLQKSRLAKPEGYFLWFPYMLIGHYLGGPELFCAFLTEPYAGQKEIIFPLMPNVYAGGYYPPFSVCTAYSNCVNLKPLINYMWGAPGSYKMWTGLRLTKLVFGNESLKQCYGEWGKLSLEDFLNKLRNQEKIKRPIGATFFRRLLRGKR